MVLRLIAILLLCGISGAEDVKVYKTPPGTEVICASPACGNIYLCPEHGGFYWERVEDAWGNSVTVSCATCIVRGVVSDTVFLYFPLQKMTAFVSTDGFSKIEHYNDSLANAYQRASLDSMLKDYEVQQRRSAIESSLRRAK